jgi:tol-pal system protein YbgF
MTKLFRAGAALVILAAAAAPAAAQNKEHVQMEAELRMLQEQQQQLSLALQQLAEALKATNTRLDANAEAMRKAFADQALTIKNLAGDVSAIAERSRDTDQRLRSLGDEIKALQTTVTSLAAGLAQGGAASSVAPVDATAPSTGTAAAPATTPAPLPSTLGLSPGRMLDQAKGDYYAGQYTLAITSFEQLIKSFPDTEAAIEANYWIGESQFYLRHDAEAIAAYNQLLQKGPRSMYAPDALYKRGQAQARMGDNAAARASYEQVLKQFPNSQSAGLAQQRLTGMNQPSPARQE